MQIRTNATEINMVIQAYSDCKWDVAASTKDSVWPFSFVSRRNIERWNIPPKKVQMLLIWFTAICGSEYKLYLKVWKRYRHSCFQVSDPKGIKFYSQNITKASKSPWSAQFKYNCICPSKNSHNSVIKSAELLTCMASSVYERSVN